MHSHVIFTKCQFCGDWEYPEGWKKTKPSGAVLGLKGNVSDGQCPICHEKEMDKILNS